MEVVDEVRAALLPVNVHHRVPKDGYAWNESCGMDGLHFSVAGWKDDVLLLHVVDVNSIARNSGLRTQRALEVEVHGVDMGEDSGSTVCLEASPFGQIISVYSPGAIHLVDVSILFHPPLYAQSRSNLTVARRIELPGGSSGGVRQVKWHPASSNHLLVLDNRSNLRLFHVDEPSPELTLPLMSTATSFTTFPSTSDPGSTTWRDFAVFWTSSSGEVSLVCPIVPSTVSIAHLSAAQQSSPTAASFIAHCRKTSGLTSPSEFVPSSCILFQVPGQQDSPHYSVHVVTGDGADTPPTLVVARGAVHAQSLSVWLFLTPVMPRWSTDPAGPPPQSFRIDIAPARPAPVTGPSGIVTVQRASHTTLLLASPSSVGLLSLPYIPLLSRNASSLTQPVLTPLEDTLTKPISACGLVHSPFLLDPIMFSSSSSATNQTVVSLSSKQGFHMPRSHTTSSEVEWASGFQRDISEFESNWSQSVVTLRQLRTSSTSSTNDQISAWDEKHCELIDAASQAESLCACIQDRIAFCDSAEQSQTELLTETRDKFNRVVQQGEQLKSRLERVRAREGNLVRRAVLLHRMAVAAGEGDLLPAEVRFAETVSDISAQVSSGLTMRINECAASLERLSHLPAPPTHEDSDLRPLTAFLKQHSEATQDLVKKAQRMWNIN